MASDGLEVSEAILDLMTRLSLAWEGGEPAKDVLIRFRLEIDCLLPKVETLLKDDVSVFRAVLELVVGEAYSKKRELVAREAGCRPEDYDLKMELVPARIIYLILRYDYSFLASPIVLRTVGYWHQMATSLVQSKERTVWSKRLQGIGRALDPAKKGNTAQFDDLILGEYELIMELFQLIRRDYLDFRKGQVTNSQIRAMDLFDSGKYDWLLKEGLSRDEAIALIAKVGSTEKHKELALNWIARRRHKKVHTIDQIIKRERKRRKIELSKS